MLLWILVKMNVGTSCMRHLPRYASVACTANSRSHSPKTYIVAMIQEGYFCSLCLFKKLATLSLMPLPTPEFLPSSFFLSFFWFIWFFVWNGCKKRIDKVLRSNSSPFDYEVLWLSNLRQGFAAMSIPIWDSRMHEIPMPIHSEMVSSDTSISQISGLSMS